MKIIMLYPMFQTRPLDSVLPIGEPVSVMVFLEDENKKMDVAVRDCWALPSEDFDDLSLPRVQLTSEEGCTMCVVMLVHIIESINVKYLHTFTFYFTFIDFRYDYTYLEDFFSPTDIYSE